MKNFKKKYIMRMKIRKSRRDDILLNVGFNPRRRKGIPVILLVILIALAGCEESKRYKISGGDTTPPGAPIFLDSRPLVGGARVFFLSPKDEDLLYVEASYISEAGKRLRFSASYFTDSLDVYGFARAGEHIIELCAVDRAGNRSISVHALVESLEPPVVLVAKSVELFSSFASMLMKWNNVLREPVYVWVDLSYTQNGARSEHTAVFTTVQSEIRSIDSLKLYADEPVSVKVSVKDKYNNVVQAKDTTIVLLTDEEIAKDRWSLPSPYSVMGSVLQVDGMRLEAVIDGLIDIDDENYFVTLQPNPWNIIIDLGEEYELSRIVTHQRWSGYADAVFGILDEQGNLYRGDNVLMYNMYGWDETVSRWELLSRRVINPPVVTVESQYTALGKAGDKAFLYPEEPRFSKPTRWFRFEAVNGKYISEITLYGRKAQ